MSTSILLIIATSVISLAAFERGSIMPESLQRPEWMGKFRFNAYLIWQKRQIYRMFTYGLIHTDYWHLLFNMLTLYFFGDYVESCFRTVLGMGAGTITYIIMYVSALAVSTSVDLFRHKDNPGYNAVGASGAVSAVIFAAIFFNPTMRISLMFIPIPTPGWLFGILYLVYCFYMDRRGMDNIGHSAHFVGAVYGFMFPLMIRPSLIEVFMRQLTN
jgi:membrane associated rhomboid family serine protease